MRLRDIGERKLIDIIRRASWGHPRVEVGVGDDAAAVKNQGRLTVVTSDSLVEGVHFPSGISPEDIGWRAAVASLSDLAAMGAHPSALLFCVLMPASTELEFFRKLFKGIQQAGRVFDAPVVGGDLAEHGTLCISGFAVGYADRVLTRSGAKPGEYIGLTGPVGAASAGLHALGHGESGRWSKLVRTFLRPKARVREGEVLARAGASAAIDVSDGLVTDLRQLARASGVRILLERVPVHGLAREYAEAVGKDPMDFALFGGDDYELVFTYPRKIERKLERALREVGCSMVRVGKIEKGKGVFLKVDDRLKPLPELGYEHFKKRENKR